MDLNVEMSDEILLSRLRNEEDNFVERKTVADQSDVLKVAVSFANSAPIGMVCAIFLGVTDDGLCEDREFDSDDLQKKVNRMLQKTYPRVPYRQRVIQTGSKQVLAVLVIGSELRPHFAGPSFVRAGSETKEATTEQLNLLIAQRTSKVYRLSTHIGKRVTLAIKWEQPNRSFSLIRQMATIMDCNATWVTLKHEELKPTVEYSYALERVEISLTTRKSSSSYTRRRTNPTRALLPRNPRNRYAPK